MDLLTYANLEDQLGVSQCFHLCEANPGTLVS